MKNEIAISFCLPVYNVADYIKDCVASIVNQDMEGIPYEIICVNDCSTDNSAEILKELQKKFPQITIVSNEENHGVAYTRNKAAEYARGEYLWFVDSDDMLIDGTVKQMYRIAKEYQADVVEGDYIRFSEQLPDIAALQPKQLEIQEGTGRPTDPNGISIDPIWAGLYRRAFLDANGLSFRAPMIAQEDTLFCWQVKLCRPKRIKCKLYCYLYRQRAGSLVHSYNEKHKIAYYQSMVIMLGALQKTKEEEIPVDLREQHRYYIRQWHEVVANSLLQITDSRYVKKQLKRLKKEGIYPYPFRKEIFLRGGGYLSRARDIFAPDRTNLVAGTPGI